MFAPFRQAKNPQGVSKYPSVAGRGDDKGRVKNGERTEEKHHLGPRAEDRGVHLAECSHEVVPFWIQAGSTEDCGSDEIKRDRRERIDDHRAPRIALEHPNPAGGPLGPSLRSVTLTGPTGVAFFKAPVRVLDELGRTHADDAKRRERRSQAITRRHLKAKSRRQFTPTDSPLGHCLEHQQIDDSNEREGGNEGCRDGLNDAVASHDQEHDRHGGDERRPNRGVVRDRPWG